MNTNKLLGLFPGQGSQKVGMGKDLYDKFDLAKEMFQSADEVLGFSLSKICFEGPAETLTETKITQPAILTVSSICYAVSQSLWETPLNLCAAAGHSLGEYSALVAAGAIRFEDAVLLVHKRGTYMQEAVPVGEGKMLAVLGKELAEIEEVLSSISEVVEIANINAPGQIVIAGSAKGVDEFAKQMGEAKMIPLPVSAPFHCQLMKSAEEKLSVDLAKLDIQTAKFPVYVNYNAKATTNPEEIREALKLQVCNQVRWVECMENSINEHSIEETVEFGAGNVLTGLMKRINKSIARKTLNSAESLVA